jgi:tRNA (mo5U34)-methyltransferase
VEFDSIRSEILRLAPWYFDVEVANGIRTSLFLEAPDRPGTSPIDVQVVDTRTGAVSRRTAFVPDEYVEQSRPHVRIVDNRTEFLRTLRSVYPEGLEGRSVLDCGCNAGAYLLWAREAGAGRCYGFDVRQRSIEQARFLASHRDDAGADVTFAVCDIYDLPRLHLDQFDVVLFNGLFYHLPDPIAALKIAAEHAKELLVIDTATRRAPPRAALEATRQPGSHITSGIYGLRWLPAGPQVLYRLLEWLGFAHSACTWWYPRSEFRDRTEIVAARQPRVLHALEGARGEGAQRICAIVSTSVPPETDVLVATGGDQALLALSQRRAWHFPQNADGSHASQLLNDADALARHLQGLARAGADYLVIPLDMDSIRAPAPAVRRLADSYRVVLREPGVSVIIDLARPERPRFRPRSGADASIG